MSFEKRIVMAFLASANSSSAAEALRAIKCPPTFKNGIVNSVNTWRRATAMLLQYHSLRGNAYLDQNLQHVHGKNERPLSQVHLPIN